MFNRFWQVKEQAFMLELEKRALQKELESVKQEMVQLEQKFSTIAVESPAVQKLDEEIRVLLRKKEKLLLEKELEVMALDEVGERSM